VNAKEEITKLIMASYDQGVADAKQAAMEAFTVAINAAVRVEREACAKVAEWEPCMTDTPKRIAAAIRARGNT
jgi:hypothetical protein